MDRVPARPFWVPASWTAVQPEVQPHACSELGPEDGLRHCCRRVQLRTTGGGSVRFNPNLYNVSGVVE